ncbi:MAG: hypothetical protein HQK60_10605 [Deltaproteobacteria bacterium]|nr:hypothetical protein [Deltaproteobacteria bacterium]
MFLVSHGAANAFPRLIRARLYFAGGGPVAIGAICYVLGFRFYISRKSWGFPEKKHARRLTDELGWVYLKSDMIFACNTAFRQQV